MDALTFEQKLIIDDLNALLGVLKFTFECYQNLRFESEKDYVRALFFESSYESLKALFDAQDLIPTVNYLELFEEHNNVMMSFYDLKVAA